MPEPEQDDEAQRMRSNYIVLGVALVIAVLGILLMLKLAAIIKQSDCVAAGHRNCAPIDMPQQQ